MDVASRATGKLTGTWQTVMSKTYGTSYFYNWVTGESRWTIPPSKNNSQERVKQQPSKTEGKRRPRVDMDAAKRLIKSNIDSRSASSTHPRSSREFAKKSVDGEGAKRSSPSGSCGMASNETESMEVERWEEEEEVAMDVSEAMELELFKSLRTTRDTLQLSSDMTEWYGIPLETCRPNLSSHLLMVLDTNVLLSHLKFLNELKDSSIKGVGKPVLVIPWVVLQELDALKKCNPSVREKAVKAINFLNECFTHHHPRVCGQTLEEVHTEVQNMAIETNDDRILHCCLVYKHKASGSDKIVLLFSNDINLCSKATVCGITAANRKTLLMDLRNLATSSITPPSHSLALASPSAGVEYVCSIPSQTTEENQKSLMTSSITDDLLCQAEMIVRVTLSYIIDREMKETFGTLSEDIVARRPPWSLEDTIFLLDKHWVAVFQFVVVPRSSEYVRSLQHHVHHRNRITPNCHDVETFVCSAIRLMQALKHKHKQATQCIAQLDIILNRVKEASVPQSSSAPSLPSSAPSPTLASPPSLPLLLPRPDLLQYTTTSSTIMEQLIWAFEQVQKSASLAQQQMQSSVLKGGVEWGMVLGLLNKIVNALDGSINHVSPGTIKTLYSSLEEYLYSVLQVSLPFTCWQLLDLCSTTNMLELFSSALSTLNNYLTFQ